MKILPLTIIAAVFLAACASTNQVTKKQAKDVLINRSSYNVDSFSFFISDDIFVDLEIILKVYFQPGVS